MLWRAHAGRMQLVALNARRAGGWLTKTARPVMVTNVTSMLSVRQKVEVQGLGQLAAVLFN
jgi:hypothetical protein